MQIGKQDGERQRQIDRIDVYIDVQMERDLCTHVNTQLCRARLSMADITRADVPNSEIQEINLILYNTTHCNTLQYNT